MENSLNPAIQQQPQPPHRGSVTSTKSLELPITPTRTHKKVSFSDSLPTNSPIPSTPTLITPTSPSSPTNSVFLDINESNTSPLPPNTPPPPPPPTITRTPTNTNTAAITETSVPTPSVLATTPTTASTKPVTEQELSALNHVLLQAANYLEKLHGARGRNANDVDATQPTSTATSAPTPLSASSATVNAPNTLSNIDATVINVADNENENVISNIATNAIASSEAAANAAPPTNATAETSNDVFDKIDEQTLASIQIDECDSTPAAVLNLNEGNADAQMSTSLKQNNNNVNNVNSNTNSTNNLNNTNNCTNNNYNNNNNGNDIASTSTTCTELQEITAEQAEEANYVNRYNLKLDSNCSAMEVEARREKIRWLLISECSALWDGGGKHTLEAFKSQFMDVEFQRKLFYLFDLDGNGYLLQDRWIEHLKGRLNEDKQVDFAEQLESVAYVICGENSRVTLRNFTEIWQARGILDKLYRLIDADGTHLVSTNQIMEFISHLTNNRPRTGIDKSSLARLEQLFRQTVGNEQGIRREEFKKIVTSKNPFFTERVFQIFDKDNSGTISLQEFIDAVHQFSGQSADDKIRFLFKVYDIDGDGLIQQKEFHDVIRACMEENSMEFSEEQIEELTAAMFEDADPANSGAMTYDALKNQLNKHGGLLENITITIDRWLVPVTKEQSTAKAQKKKKFTDYIPIPHQFTPLYMKNNTVYISYLLFYIGVNVGLFISRAIQYRASNGFTIVARACGQCLNFNCAWVLVLMLRHSITFLRSHGLSSYLPLDHHVYLHKLTGIVISVLSLLHTIMHVFNFSMVVIKDPLLNSGNYTLSEWLLTDRPHLFGLVPGCANPTGVALFIILLIMYICSQPFVRRGGSFEIFYWTHLLYVPFWILTLFHGPNFWKWFLLPGLAYIVERIFRMYWMHGEHGKTYISSGILLPSKVIHLVIRRPNNFHFRPGDYVFVNIPTIANYEWHPFTISSAPEQEDYMWLHIRTAGQWTKKLYEYFEQEHEKLQQFAQKPNALVAQLKAAQYDSINEITATTPSICDADGKPSPTPQIDFLSKNLAKLQTTTGEMTAAPIRPPRQHQQQQNAKQITIPSGGQHALDSNNSQHNNQPSEGRKDRIRSIKRTLERTFSSKNSNSAKSNNSDLDSMNTQGKRNKTAPLERSLTVPNVKRPEQKRLHTIARSESDSQFNELPVAVKNKSVEQSFRYMRNKPTIIAFKTPSMEECDPANILGLQNACTAKDAEEGAVMIANAMSKPAKPLEDASVNGTQTRTRISRFRRPTFLRSLSISIKNHGSNGSLPMQGTAHSGGKITLDAGVLEIYIDGPYGAPSSHIFGAQHAVLIGTGIGVTPFASILQSIMHRYWKARHTCPHCKYEWASDIPKSVMNLRKVDFFWINRDQRSFEWFVNLLTQLEIEQAELGGAMNRFLDMHMYITSALQRNDMKAVGLQLALDLLHEKSKRDLITGLKTRTNAGRPNWDKVFQQLKAQRKGKVTVFYCGPPQLARTLRYKCDEYGFAFRKESF